MNDDKIWHESIDDDLIIKDSKLINFHYPINPGETINFRDSLASKLVNLYKELKPIKIHIMMNVLHLYLV